jgi:hypothetical protein
LTGDGGAEEGEMAGPTWSRTMDDLRALQDAASAQANVALLQSVEPRWESVLEVRTSMNDLLFTRTGEKYPWHEMVRVAWAADVFEFRLLRKDLLVTADRCRATNAPAVLDAFLMQLATETPPT